MDAWERCQALLRAQSSLSLALALATLYLLWWYLQSVQRQRSCPKNAKLAESAWRLPIIGSPAVYRNMWRPLESLVEQHMLVRNAPGFQLHRTRSRRASHRFVSAAPDVVVCHIRGRLRVHGGSRECAVDPERQL